MYIFAPSDSSSISTVGTSRRLLRYLSVTGRDGTSGSEFRVMLGRVRGLLPTGWLSLYILCDFGVIFGVLAGLLLNQ